MGGALCRPLPRANQRQSRSGGVSDPLSGAFKRVLTPVRGVAHAPIAGPDAGHWPRGRSRPTSPAETWPHVGLRVTQLMACTDHRRLASPRTTGGPAYAAVTRTRVGHFVPHKTESCCAQSVSHDRLFPWSRADLDSHEPRSAIDFHRAQIYFARIVVVAVLATHLRDPHDAEAFRHVALRARCKEHTDHRSIRGVVAQRRNIRASSRLQVLISSRGHIGHHAADSGTRLGVVKALASLDPRSGLTALTTPRTSARMALT